MAENTIATVVCESAREGGVVVGLRHTNYQLHLTSDSTIDAHHHTRIKGVIRANVWKVDFVSKGGAYIEPVAGKPRRIQGKVIGHVEGENSIIVEVWNTPIIGELPERWTASEIAEGTKVAIDVQDTPDFQAVPA